MKEIWTTYITLHVLQCRLTRSTLLNRHRFKSVNTLSSERWGDVGDAICIFALFGDWLFSETSWHLVMEWIRQDICKKTKLTFSLSLGNFMESC